MQFDYFLDWLKLFVSATTYTYSRGMWVDSTALNDKRIIAVNALPGLAPDVDDRYLRYRVIMLGPRNGRNVVKSVEADIEQLALAALGGSAPCGAAQVRALNEPAGPIFTTENRPAYQMDFEVVY